MEEWHLFGCPRNEKNSVFALKIKNFQIVQRGWWVSRPKFLEGSMKLNWNNFPDLGKGGG